MPETQRLEQRGLCRVQRRRQGAFKKVNELHKGSVIGEIAVPGLSPGFSASSAELRGAGPGQPPNGHVDGEDRLGLGRLGAPRVARVVALGAGLLGPDPAPADPHEVGAAQFPRTGAELSALDGAGI